MSRSIGSLEVTVIDATQLPVVSHLGKQNPFVVLVVGAERRQTKPSKGSHRYPVWGERLDFVIERGTTEMSLDVYHDSNWGKPGFIGSATVPLTQVLAKGSDSRRVRVGGAGEIKLQIVFIKSQTTTQHSNGNSNALASQAMRNASSSLDTALSSRRAANKSSAGQSWRNLQPNVDVEGPAWLSGSPGSSKALPVPEPARSASIQPASLQPAAPQAVPIEEWLSNGFEEHKADPFTFEGGKRSSGTGNRLATSPQKSLRLRIGHKLGNFWPGKDGCRSNSLNTEASGLFDKQSGQISDSGTEAVSEAAHPADGPSSRPLIDLDDELQGLGQDPLERHAAGNTPPQPQLEDATKMPNMTSSWQHLPMEPVEAIQYEHPQGGRGYYSAWEHRASPPRRATDSSLPLNAQQQAPRRQTDSSVSDTAPVRESDGTGPEDDDQSGFYRRRLHVREFEEGKGRLPPMTASRFPESSALLARAHPDLRTQHERLVSATEERSRSSLTQGWPGPSLFAAQPPVAQGQDLQTMDTAMQNLSVADRRERGSEVASAASQPISTVGRRKHQGLVGASSAASPEGSATGAEAREDSGEESARPSVAFLDTSYPVPQYNNSADDIARCFDGLQGECESPFFASSFSPERQRHSRSVPSNVSSQGRQGSHSRGFDDTSYMGAAAPPSSQHEAPASFAGMKSPFAEDNAPLEAESLPSSDTSQELVSQKRSRGTAGGRVPIKDVRQEIEAGAEGSVRIKNANGDSGNSQQSLQALLSESKNDWLLDEKDLEIAVNGQGQPIKLGSGSFGTVYKGIYDQSTEVAIKTLKCETKEDMDAALFEVAILKKQLHPNIVQFLGVSIGENSIQMVTELLAGNLFSALRKKNCTWHKGGKSIAKNIASALSFLHKKKIVHLDVKSANILLATSKVAKLGDLGLSAMMNTNSFVDTIKGLGTLQWTSPEVLLGSHAVTCASDVYSFGVVLWEICTGEIPVRGRLRPITAQEAPSEVAELVWQCLDQEPRERPTMANAFIVLKDL